MRKHLDLITKTFSERIDDIFKNYPTRREVFDKFDHIDRELEAIRQEQILTAHSQTDLDDRLTSVEKKLNIHTPVL